MPSKLRIIVAGLAALNPVGGMAWHYLQYVIGLTRLGHEVYYHEDTWSWPYHPIEKTPTNKGHYSAKFLGDFFNRYAPDLKERWHYLHLHETSFGMDRVDFDEIAKTADLFLNVSGASILPDKLSQKCVKVFLDTDPGYNQIVLNERFPWSENVDRWSESVTEHDQHFTYAENIHGTDCKIPKVGLEWKTTRMPVVMCLWDSVLKKLSPTTLVWTTVMTWNAFKGKLIYKGREYKSKGAEFNKFVDLPQNTQVPFKVAVGGVDAPFQQLARSGWDVVDGPSSTLTPNQYQEFIAGSRGEFSIAKNVYVALHTGWFSDRSTCYLASGRPVVVQETGFSKVLPTGEGLLSFSTMKEAVDAIHEVEANYTWHSKAARAIAEEYFDSDKVLSKFIEDAMSKRMPAKF